MRCSGKSVRKVEDALAVLTKGVGGRHWKGADITLACCVLHKFCIIMGDDVDDFDAQQ